MCEKTLKNCYREVIVLSKLQRYLQATSHDKKMCNIRYKEPLFQAKLQEQEKSGKINKNTQVCEYLKIEEM